MRRWLLVALLALGAAWFAWRGPVQALRVGGQYDFKLIYSGARAWLTGADPYDHAQVHSAWSNAGGAADDLALVRPESSLVYAPPTFVILSPVAALPWPAAGIVWVGLNLVLFIASVSALRWLAGLRGEASRWFWAAALWLAPFHTGFKLGQLALLTLALVAGAHWLRVRAGDRKGGSLAAGAMIGAAAVLKPQLGLLFLIYEAGRLRWRSAAAGLVLAGLLTAIGAARLAAAGVDWWPAWRGHIAEFSFHDGDPTQANAYAYLQYQLAYPLHTLTDDRTLVQAAVLAILGGLSLAYFVIDLRRGGSRGEGRAELLSLSMAAVVTLLIAYHRIYDAVLVLFPLAMGIAMVSRGDGERRERLYGAGVLLLLAPLLAPGSIVFKAVEQRGVLPEALTHSWFWETVLLPHATWSLLGLCVLLVLIRARIPAANPFPAPNQSTP